MFGIDDAILAAGVSAAGGLIGNAMSSSSASSAQDFSAQQYATRYQTTVKDLEAAGLSPMLAYSQGAGSAPTGVSFTAQNPFAGVASAYSSSKNLDAAREQMLSSASQSRSQANVLNETVAKVKQEVSNLVTDQAKAKALIDNLYETRQNLVKEGYNLTEQGNLIRSSIDKIKAEIPGINLETVAKELNNKLIRLDVQSAESVGGASRYAKEFKPFADILLRAIGVFKK